MTEEETVFDTLHLICTWEEPVMITKLNTVVANFPSGVNENDFTILIVEDESTLEITFTWPDPMINLEILHQKLHRRSGEDGTCTSTIYHPVVLDLEDALKIKRPQANSNVISTARITLPFAVQALIDQKSNSFFKSTAGKVVCIKVREIAESYAIVNDDEEFE